MFVLERQLMFKVVLVLKQVVLRLKECDVDVVVRKKKEQIILASRIKIVNGFSSVNVTTEFYVDEQDLCLSIYTILYLGADRKFGGETLLNILEWQPNVIHTNISVLSNSPDKQSRLSFTFYYFRDSSVMDKRRLFLSNDRYQPQCENIERSNTLLANQKLKLEQEVVTWEKKNEALEVLRGEKEASIYFVQQSHLEQVENCQRNIEAYSQQCEASKSVREELVQLAKAKGLEHSELL